MRTALTKFGKILATAGAGAVLVALASVANAAQCRSTIDEAGEPVILCGTVAYDADDEDDDEPDSFDDMYEDDGTLFVDVEDCEPGNYWMLETDEIDVPMACP
jgi:hypothetical protein